MPAPIIPWAPSNIPSEIQSELDRRKINRSFVFVPNSNASWDKDTGDWNQYRGPMVSWIRVCSNGRGRRNVDSSTDRPRFVLRGGRDFYQTYGFYPLSKVSGQQVIGYTPENLPHIIENSLATQPTDAYGNPSQGNHPIHVATPEVSRLEVVIQKELYRRATIEWVCFSWKQLEYMAPYFLVPGISIMIEWGWNHFNPASLVDLTNINGKEPNLRSLWNNAYPLYIDNILKSRGNYDVVYGIVTNFNWSVEGNKIICSTEVTSKDRLYSGIAKDSSLKATSQSKAKDEPPQFIMSIRQFLNKADIAANFKSVAVSSDPLTTALTLGKEFNAINRSANTSTTQGGKGVDNQPLVDIVNSIVSASPAVRKVKLPYIHGVFTGRRKEDALYAAAKPGANDFDSDNAPPTLETLWLNMGLIVEILNYFSSRPGVAKDNMFEVDITSTIINGHPNLISCKSEVLIPNYQAPKYHYGAVGKTNSQPVTQPPPETEWTVSPVNGVPMRTLVATPSTLPPSDYDAQYLNPLDAKTPADEAAGLVLYQFKVGATAPGAGPGLKKVYRNNLDKWINWYRYQNIGPGPYSFPSDQDVKITVLNSNDTLTMEKDYAGLLSNIYVNLGTLKSIVDEDTITSYKDIYDKLLEVIMTASDQFWDLSITENEGKMVICDRKRIDKTNIDKQQGDPLYVFDYYDSDSLIKTLKFRPALTDAQATRAIYGEVNNPNSKYSVVDPNDLLRFYFKDDVVLPDNDRVTGGSESKINDQNNFGSHLRIILTELQTIDKKKPDELQMTVPNPVNPAGKREILKLVMPDQELLRLLLHDGDRKGNPIYCAIQPGITLELGLLGIGGIRTFQYFLIRNLPEPYSHRNVIYRVIDVHQSLEAGNWETVIRAGLIPLTEYIKDRVKPKGGWPKEIKASERPTPNLPA